jgi:hypothetical protein
MLSLELELIQFDMKNKQPLPPVLSNWRKRWMKAIEKEKAKLSIPRTLMGKSL